MFGLIFSPRSVAYPFCYLGAMCIWMCVLVCVHICRVPLSAYASSVSPPYFLRQGLP